MAEGELVAEEVRFWHAERNRGAVDRLCTQLNKGIGIGLFVGAGVSRQFGYPGWQDLLLTMARSCNTEAEVDRLLAKGEYEVAADVLIARMGRATFNDWLEDQYADSRISSLRSADLSDYAANFLPFLASGPVITTNFDHVLERVFSLANRPFDHIVWGAKAADLVRKAFHENLRVLVKVHGDCVDPVDRVLTRDEYFRHYGDLGSDSSMVRPEDKPLPFLLNRILTFRPTLFVGCSLEEDRTVDLMRALSRRAGATVHWALLEDPGPSRLMDRQLALDSLNIRPIWYPKGRHSVVSDFLEWLVRSSEKWRTNLDRYEQARSTDDLVTLVSAGTPLLLERLPIRDLVDDVPIALLRLAKQDLEAGRIETAIDRLNEVIQSRPDAAPAYILRGLAWFRAKLYRFALRDFSKAVQLQPDNADALSGAVLSRMMLGDVSGAIPMLNHCLTIQPDNWLMLAIRGVWHLSRPDIDGARSDLLNAQSLKPNNPTAHLLSLIGTTERTPEGWRGRLADWGMKASAFGLASITVALASDLADIGIPELLGRSELLRRRKRVTDPE